ncbi:MAG TPA: M6 family metalloprotease domain-containing protein [Clostridiales bacterium]|nr:M6 family metalloprotease domain-containing protein [Clostridiales bacterium]
MQRISKISIILICIIFIFILSSCSLIFDADYYRSTFADTSHIEKSGKDRSYGQRRKNFGDIQNAKNIHNVLVVLIEFDDVKLKTDALDWYEQIFQRGANSVNDYYAEMSNNLFSFVPARENHGIIDDGIVEVSLGLDHPGDSDNDLEAFIAVFSALEAADEYVDFASFDANNDGVIACHELHIICVLAGYEGDPELEDGPCVSSYFSWLSDDLYKFTLDNKMLNTFIYTGELYFDELNTGRDSIATISIICHELGHSLGLPDLYDTDESSLGVGVHSLMGSGTAALREGELIGETPVPLDPWSMIFLGFIEPTVVTQSGEYKVYSASTGKYNILKIPTPNPNEYYLIENRQLEGYYRALEKEIKGGGVAIWHIDESVINDSIVDEYGTKMVDGLINDDESRKGVALIEASMSDLGYSQLDDLEPGMDLNEEIYNNYDHYFYLGGNNVFGPDTTPSSTLNDGSPSNITVIVGSSGPVMDVKVKLGQPNK